MSQLWDPFDPDLPVAVDTKDDEERLAPVRKPLDLDLEDTAWGIDPSTKRVVLAAVMPGGGFEHEMVTIPQPGDESRRLEEAFNLLVPAFRFAASHWPMPGRVSVEQPFAFGRNVHPQSYYMVGTVLLALRVAGIDCPIFTRGPGQWKLGAMGAGFGAAKKAYILHWARSVGFQETCPKCGEGSSDKKKDCKHDSSPVHDKADALGLAVDVARLVP